MSRSLSIADLVDVEREELAFLPTEENGGRGAPQFCLSLRRAGDMKRPRAGEGASESARRRAGIFRRLGIAEERVAALHQIHSQKVFVVEDEWSASGEGDGLLTANPRTCLAVTAADCLPILLHDRRSGALALVHSGWRGTGIALVALERMARRFGTRASEVSALVGPGIGACCYKVSDERGELFRRQWGEQSVVDRDGGVYLDLPGVNERMLSQAGVAEVALVRDCTSCSDFLGSFRREGPERYTRMLALVGHFG